MRKSIQQIKFENRTYTKSYFEIVQIEELLLRELNHDVRKNHIVNFFVIFFVTEGEGYHTIDFTDYKYKKGTVLFIRKDQVQKFFKSSNVKGYLLVFTEEFIISHMNQMEALKSLQLFNELLNFPKIELNPTQEEFINFVNLIRHLELEYQFKDGYSLGITRSVLHIIITKLFRIKSERGQLIEKKKYISEFLTFQKLVEEKCFERKKVKDYAKMMGISAKTLNNIVQSVVNKPAKNFIDEITIMQIKRLLISTNQSIKEIAYRIGFDEPTNFFRYFKKFVGSSPEVFRQANN